MTSSLSHDAPDRWVFDEEVAECFEDMLARSIPQYEVMRQTVYGFALPYAQAGGFVVDLGCSAGGALERFVVQLGHRCRYLGVDASEPMVELARERFAGHQGVVEIRHHDLRGPYPDVACACVTLAVLVLQFVPINYRQRILRSVYETTRAGGCLVVVEKVLGNGPAIDEAMVSAYHAQKVANGYSPDQVERKRLSLEGVLVPVTAQWNEQMLRTAGFSEVDCIWRWSNFAAWLAVKR